MNWAQLQRACSALVSVAKKHQSSKLVQLEKAERKTLLPLTGALSDALWKKHILPKRVGGRPKKQNAGDVWDKTLRGWQVLKFIESVDQNCPIENELLQKVARSARAVQYGEDPELVFRINDGKPDTRGLSPIGKRRGILLNEIEVAVAVDDAIQKYKQLKITNPKTRAYADVASFFSISESRARDLYRLALSRAPEGNEAEKIQWIRQTIH